MKELEEIEGYRGDRGTQGQCLSLRDTVRKLNVDIEDYNGRAAEQFINVINKAKRQCWFLCPEVNFTTTSPFKEIRYARLIGDSNKEKGDERATQEGAEDAEANALIDDT